MHGDSEPGLSANCAALGGEVRTPGSLHQAVCCDDFAKSGRRGSSAPTSGRRGDDGDVISISQTAGIGQKNSSAMAHSDENEIGSDFHSLSPDDILCMVKAIDLVSHTAECREKIVSGGAVLLFNNLLTSMYAHVQVPLSIYFSPS